MLTLYNTLTRQKEEFHPIHGSKVGVYSCGPTVYWFAHIGNMRAFLFADVLCRTLRFNGFSVRQVMNITDVGHLTDDEDAGEDKMIVAMKREGKSVYEIADFYTEAFHRDIALLNIVPADLYPRAAEHIEEQIEMIKALEKNGYTYQTTDGIYFDTSKLDVYGRLSRQKSEEKQAGARVDIGNKKNSTDFALWKLSPDPTIPPLVKGRIAQRQMEWPSPWGVGFPGWHIECSAMSKKYLGVPFDIHTGGVDHIAVHHENEIAQTQGADQVLEAHVWMHSEFVTIDGGKMSKSLGNIFTISDLVEKGFDPLAFRYFVLGAHYRSKLNFTWEALTAAQNALDRLHETIRDFDTPAIGCAEYESRFLEAIQDDLNSPQALAITWELLDSDYPTSAKAESLLKFDEVLGLRLAEYVATPLQIPEEVKTLLEERSNARVEKNWNESDRLRDEIAKLGFIVEDTSEGQKVKTKR